MNEYYFFFHCGAVLLFLFSALYLGKEALVAFISACWLFANFFVTKQVILFGYETTASDVYAIGSMFGLAMLQEYWGQNLAKSAVWISFFVLIFAACASSFHLSYIPSHNDTMHTHYDTLLSPTPRLIGASLATFLITQYIEIIFFSFLKRFSRIPFFIRTTLSTCSVQFLDTWLFTFLGLSGLVHSLFDVVIVSYSIKLLVILLSAPFLAFSKLIIPERPHVTI